MRTKLLLLVLACALPAVAAERRVHQAVNLNADGRLSLNTHNGSVTITAWNQPRVEIDARIEPGDDDYAEDVDKVEVRISGSGASVRVETNYDAVPWHSDRWFSHTRSLPPVHYTISMPATASLSIDDHNATVRVAGLQSEVRITGHNGRIDLRDHAGNAVINVHNAAVQVALRSVRPLDIETHNGSIDVQLPADARFSVNAQGNHLGVDSDFAVVTKRLNRESYIGDVNGGGPQVRISTHNGALRLRRG